MKTKALVLSAMIGFTGMVCSFGASAVYSLTLTNTFSLIANQLDNGTGNRVTNLFHGVPVQTAIYKFNGDRYDQLTYLGGAAGWKPDGNRNMSLSPGEGVFVRKPAAIPEINVTFQGTVLEGELVNPVVVGFGIYSGMVPQRGGITSVHGYLPANNDVVYKFTGGVYASKTWLAPLNRWTPAPEPILEVGEAVFIKSMTAKNWTRTFHIN